MGDLITQQFANTAWALGHDESWPQLGAWCIIYTKRAWAFTALRFAFTFAESTVLYLGVLFRIIVVALELPKLSMYNGEGAKMSE